MIHTNGVRQFGFNSFGSVNYASTWQWTRPKQSFIGPIEIQIMEWEENGKKSLYHGETSRTLCTREKEHCYQSRVTHNESKPLLKHNVIHHPGKQSQVQNYKDWQFSGPIIQTGKRRSKNKQQPITSWIPDEFKSRVSSRTGPKSGDHEWTPLI